MNELQEKIVAIVDANDGSVSWPILMDGLDYPERQQAMTNVRVLDQAGILKRIVVWNPATGKNTFTVDRVGD